MQRVISLNCGLFVCPARAADIVGIRPSSMRQWVRRAVTSYGYPLNVVDYQTHKLIDERDVRVMELVQRDFPLKGGGPGPRRRCEQMKEYAMRLRGGSQPTPR